MNTTRKWTTESTKWLIDTETKLTIRMLRSTDDGPLHMCYGCGTWSSGGALNCGKFSLTQVDIKLATTLVIFIYRVTFINLHIKMLKFLK